MNAAAEEKLPGSYEIEFSSKIAGGKQINRLFLLPPIGRIFQHKEIYFFEII